MSFKRIQNSRRTRTIITLLPALLVWTTSCSRGVPLDDCPTSGDCDLPPSATGDDSTGSTGDPPCAAEQTSCVDSNTLARCNLDDGELEIVDCANICGPQQHSLGCGLDESGRPQCQCAEDDAGSDTSSGLDESSSSGTSSSEETTGAVDECPDPSNVVGPPVYIQIRNDGDAPIYLDDSLCFGATRIDILGPLPDLQPVRTLLKPCEWTCDQAVFNGGHLCESCSQCDYSHVLLLAPGGTVSVQWSGVSYQQHVLPEACQNCGGSCTAAVQASKGLYSMIARAHSAITDCLECSCTPDAQGTCQLVGALAGDVLVADEVIDYPAQTMLTLSFP